jgi:hypothetical protein
MAPMALPTFLDYPANLRQLEHDSPAYPNASELSKLDVASKCPMSPADDRRDLVNVQQSLHRGMAGHDFSKGIPRRFLLRIRYGLVEAISS